MTIAAIQEMIKIVRPELGRAEEKGQSSFVYVTLINGKEIDGILRIAVSDKSGVVEISHKVGQKTQITTVFHENIVSISHRIN